MGRLKSVTDGEGTIYEYEFDGYGNISREHEISEKGINTKQYFYDKNNRLILSDCDDETIQYEYDNAGNLIEKTTGFGGRIKKSYYTYDGYNRLSEYICDGVISEYTYNLEGLRESKKVGDKYTRFMYDGMNVIGELTNDNYYIYHRGTELIGYESFKGDSYYYRQDQHGNVTAVLDYTGKEIKTYSYNAYGEKDGIKIESAGDRTILYQWKAETEKIHNPFGYCGEYTDDETGLVYLRNRYYDPTSARFTQEDPIQDGLNWYAYCGGNPIMFEDPWGLVKKGDEKYSQSVQDEIAIYTQVWNDAETAYSLGIIENYEKQAVQQYAENSADEIRYRADHPYKTFFRDAVEFVAFDIILGDFNSGTVYAADLSVSVLEKMYGDIDNLSSIVNASNTIVAATVVDAKSKGRNLVNTKINGKMTRVDIEFPQGGKPANLHVQIKGTGQKIMIESMDDLSKLPKSVAKNNTIVNAIKKGLKLIGKLF